MWVIVIKNNRCLERFARIQNLGRVAAWCENEGPARGGSRPHAAVIPVHLRETQCFAECERFWQAGRAPMFSRTPLRLGPSFGSFRTTLIATAKLNAVDSQDWLADVLRRITDHAAAALRTPAVALAITREVNRGSAAPSPIPDAVA